MTGIEEYYRQKVSQEAFDFFAVFSRFEYALKFSDYRQDNKAEASWHKFAEALEDEFYERMRGAPEAQIYFDRPPDQLVLKNGGIDWDAVEAPADGKALFMALKRARNNLFHGDKRHDNGRDRDLMIAGLFVLNEAYRAAEKTERCQDFVSKMELGL